MVPKQSTICNPLIEAIYPPPYNHLHSSIHLSICMYVFLVSYALGSQLSNPSSSHPSSRCACSTEHHIAWNMPAHLYINILYNGNLAQSTIFHPVLQYSTMIRDSIMIRTLKSKIALCVRVLRYKNPPVRDIHAQRTHPNVKFQAKLGTVTSSSIACFGERDMAGNCSCPYSASYLLSLHCRVLHRSWVSPHPCIQQVQQMKKQRLVVVTCLIFMLLSGFPKTATT